MLGFNSLLWFDSIFHAVYAFGALGVVLTLWFNILVADFNALMLLWFDAFGRLSFQNLIRGFLCVDVSCIAFDDFDALVVYLFQVLLLILWLFFYIFHFMLLWFCCFWFFFYISSVAFDPFDVLLLLMLWWFLYLRWCFWCFGGFLYIFHVLLLML